MLLKYLRFLQGSTGFYGGFFLHYLIMAEFWEEAEEGSGKVELLRGH